MPGLLPLLLLDAVQHLEKSDLASMAESLVAIQGCSVLLYAER